MQSKIHNVIFFLSFRMPGIAFAARRLLPSRTHIITWNSAQSQAWNSIYIPGSWVNAGTGYGKIRTVGPNSQR